MEAHTSEFDARAQEIADDVGAMIRGYGDFADVIFSYAYGLTPVIDVTGLLPVFDCEHETETAYDAVEAALDAVKVAGPGYKITAQFHDSSGYAYWREEGDPLSIMIVAEIVDITKVDSSDLDDEIRAVSAKLYAIMAAHCAS